jgi:hypothetical protein
MAHKFRIGLGETGYWTDKDGADFDIFCCGSCGEIYDEHEGSYRDCTCGAALCPDCADDLGECRTCHHGQPCGCLYCESKEAGR